MRTFLAAWLLPLAPLATQPPPADLQRVAAEFSAHVVNVDGQRYPYRLLAPLPQHLDQQRPLVVFLHGAGERGDDNVSQLKWLPERMVLPELRQRFACYVVAVQCPRDERWVDAPWAGDEPPAMQPEPTRALRAAMLAMAEALRLDGVDHSRVYVTGLSMGGYGCWDLLAREPERFAAGLPVCGGGDPATVARLCGVPIEFWHGDQDLAVPVQRSRLMADAMRRLGLPVHYHELPGVGHDSWRQAYGPAGSLDWLFAQDQRQQQRGACRAPAVVPALPVADRAEGSFRLPAGSRCHAPRELEVLATHLFESLQQLSLARPVAAPDGEVRGGDLVLQFGSPATITVADTVTVSTPDLRSMRHALAVLRQLFDTPGGIPTGTYLLNSSPSLTLSIAATDARWQRGSLLGLLHAGWLEGVDRIWLEPFGPRTAVASAALFDDLQADARRIGIIVLDEAPTEPVAARFGIAQSLLDVLSGSKSSAPEAASSHIAVAAADRDEARTLHVAVTAATPEQALMVLGSRLPAFRERYAAAGRPVHFGGFLSRLGRRWR